MSFLLGNPAGLWALFGIPAVLLIHFLQREARRWYASTLFLLDHLGQESAEGRVFERIRNSAALWLQLLAVLLLTWLLVQPRWLRTDSFQRVAVVLDSSVSMQAFQPGLADRLHRELGGLRRASATTEWRLLESDPARPTLYAGTGFREMCEQVSGWAPRLGAHDVGPAVGVARSLVGSEGVVVLVTDRRPPDTEERNYSLLGIGRPLDNVGFTGLRLSGDPGQEVWEALLRNYGEHPVDTVWRLALDGQTARREALRLDPGEARLLKGGFPAGRDAFALELADDPFPLDNRLSVVSPKPKPLRMSIRVDEDILPLVERLTGNIRHASRVRPSESPDIEWTSYRPGILPPLDAHRICFPPGQPARENVDGDDGAGLVVAEEHPLTAGLRWQALLSGRLEDLSLTERDEVLVWRGERPIVLLRREGDIRQLIFAFDVVGSNAGRLPAFVVLLHRYVESVRAGKRMAEVRNVEVNQLLSPAVDPEGPPLRILRTEGGDEAFDVPAHQAATLRAPALPGRFRVTQGGRTVLTGAAHFADSREADFRRAESFSDLRDTVALSTRKNTVPDPWAPAWVSLLTLAILLSWAWPGRRT